MAEQNLQVTGDVAKVQSIDFAERFGESLVKVKEAIGVTRTMPLASGMTIKTYKSSVDLVEGSNIGEGEIIPLSRVKTEPDKVIEVTFDKYRKAVSAEAIQRHGYNQAVAETDDKLLKEIQKGVRKDFFDFLAQGTGSASAKNLQGALAQAWGQVQSLFEDDSVQTVAFVNPLDIADYIGNANVSTQTVFGLTFISGFTNVTVISNTSVPKGTVYATAPENIVLAYVQIGGGELGNAFDFTTEELGLIGVTHGKEINNLTVETVALSGVKLFAERLDGVVKVEIAPEV